MNEADREQLADVGPGGDGADPIGAAVARLVAAAPPFSPGQRALLARLLGGARVAEGADSEVSS